jgi:ADP-heptose:LPS heptosyltransferase
VKTTPGRLLRAAAVRALQAVTGNRDAHALLLARARRWREDLRGRRAPIPDEALRDRRRVLVCKTEQRGDVILAIPALRALRSRYPDARLTVLAGPWSVELLRAVPGVDEVLVLDHPPLAFEAGRLPTGAERAELVAKLKQAGFDLGVDLTGDPWLIRVLAEAGVTPRIGPRDSGASELLHRSVSIPPDLHRVEGMLSIVGLAGAATDDASPRLAPPEAVRREAERTLSDLGVAPPFVVVHPGGRALKRWPVERHVELVSRLIRHTSDTVVILAGPDEPEVAAAFSTAAGAGRVKLWPGGSFLAVGELIRRARLFIGNDSGVAHLAAAVGATTVTIFGPARVSRWAPRSERGSVLSTDEACAYPCWPSVYAEPCSHHRCVRNLSVDRVFEQVRARLGAGSGGAAHSAGGAPAPRALTGAGPSP